MVLKCPKKRRGIRYGLLVWGIILSVLSIVSLLCFIVSPRVNSVYTNVSLIYSAIFTFINGQALILIFIGVSISTLKYNKEVDKYNSTIDTNTPLVARCWTCQNSVIARIEDFRTHKRFPEGFVYCPYCKTPISANAFVYQYQPDSIGKNYGSDYNTAH